ncbi:unnamed protein product, partial [marine sediment metagenome]
MDRKDIILKLKKRILKEPMLKEIFNKIVSYFPDSYLVG